MSSSKKAASFQKDVPWRVSSSKPIPKIHHSPLLRVSHSPYTLSVMKHPDPIGSGLATGAIVEAAGPDCIVPGQIMPVKLLGVKGLRIHRQCHVSEERAMTYVEEVKSLQLVSAGSVGVWPIDVNLKFMEPVERELKLLGKFMDSAVNLMNKSFLDPMLDENLRRGPWLQEEDSVLTDFVNVLGERRWDYIAKVSGLRRSGKSCRLRWKNYLQPNLKHGDISAEEERIIVQLHEQWGNRWSRIAKNLPGRTDNEIKNYWKTYLRKKAKDEAQAEKFQPGMDNDGKEDFFISDGHTSTMDGSECMSSSSNIVSSTYPCLDSPYEMRIFDWFADLSNDKDEMKCRVCNNLLDSCCCYFECESGNEPNYTWDDANSIWDWKMS